MIIGTRSAALGDSGITPLGYFTGTYGASVVKVFTGLTPGNNVFTAEAGSTAWRQAAFIRPKPLTGGPLPAQGDAISQRLATVNRRSPRRLSTPSWR